MQQQNSRQMRVAIAFGIYYLGSLDVIDANVADTESGPPVAPGAAPSGEGLVETDSLVAAVCKRKSV